MKGRNKTKVSITLDERLMRFIDVIRGDIPRSKFIENYLKDKVNLFEAVWIFSNEFSKVTKREIILAHLSQPLGQPLHKHTGFIELNRDGISFYDESFKRLFSVKPKKSNQPRVGYDGVFTRISKSRGTNPPLRLSVNKEKLYFFVKAPGETVFRGDNPKFMYALSNIL